MQLFLTLKIYLDLTVAKQNLYWYKTELTELELFE